MVLVGVLALAALGVAGVALVLVAERAAAPLSPAPTTPAPAPAPAGIPMPSRLDIIHSGADAFETNRQLAPTLDPLLRACIDLRTRPLGQGITYAIYINADGTPSRLQRMYGVASSEESACIERVLLASRWPPRLSTWDPALVILTPVY